VEAASGDIFVDPAELTVAADTEVTITLPSEGAISHNVAVDALGVSVDVASGKTQTASFSAAGSTSTTATSPVTKPPAWAARSPSSSRTATSRPHGPARSVNRSTAAGAIRRPSSM
jgi:hypothetical protein